MSGLTSDRSSNNILIPVCVDYLYTVYWSSYVLSSHTDKANKTGLRIWAWRYPGGERQAGAQGCAV